MSEHKCFCGARAVRCHGTLILKKAGGQKLICSHCRTYGGTLKAGQKVGNRCQALVCAQSRKPLLKCPGRRFLPGVSNDNRCGCGGKAYVCNGRMKPADRGGAILRCDRCGALLESAADHRKNGRCLAIICASSHQPVTICKKRPKLKKPPKRRRQFIVSWAR